MAKVVLLLLLLALVPVISMLPSSSLALNQDFCIADLARGNTPAGYQCKPQTVISLLPSSSLALNQDFGIADLALGNTPDGNPCKPQTAVTADDFYYRGLGTTGPTINPFSMGLSSAFVTRFPGVNGLGISAARVDFAPGGVVPLHSHPGGTELLYVIEGTMSAGFISSLTNKVYSKTLYKGDLMVFPQGLLHYQCNLGNETAVALSSYSSANPGLMILDFALFANNLPSDVVSKLTVLDELQVRKLKALFGGSG